MPSLSKHIERVRYYCEEASVGYDWDRRYDLYDGGDTDCSWLTIGCLKEAGFDTGDATWTGNMSSNLCARGWERLPADISQARPGDILLNDANHVATVVEGYGWNAKVGQASIGETGNVRGNQPGDQTGYETNISPIYDYPWNCILRWTGEDDYEGDDDMRAADVWEYDYEGSAPGGNMYNAVTGMARAIIEPHESAAGDGSYGTLGDRIDYIDMRVRELAVNNAALSEAVKALAEAKGTDSAAIAKAVEKAVKARLEKIKVTVS